MAAQATVACELHHAFSWFSWTGVYRVAGGDGAWLVVGPYQGSLGCLRIRVGRGVCGTCARTRVAQLVPDVHAFPGHIACDSGCAPADRAPRPRAAATWASVSCPAASGAGAGSGASAPRCRAGPRARLWCPC